MASNCAHPYFPLRSGYEAVFKNTFPSPIDGSAQVTTYVWNVTGVTASSADLSLKFGTSALSVTQHLRCENGNLSATNFVDMTPAGSQLGFQVETQRASGAYLPADLKPGSEWTQSFDLILRPQGEMAAAIGDISETTVIRRKALREESVTVPAGRYTALRVESRATVQLHGSGAPELGSADNLEIVTTEWWVKNVGLVKTTAGLPGGFQATAEAERISL